MRGCMKVYSFQILCETYIIFSSYDTLHIGASDVPSDIGQCRAQKSVTSKLNGMLMQKQVLLN
jgi:hypothetical protein